MSSLLARIGGACAAHPRRTVIGWLAILALALGLSTMFGGSPHDDYRIPGSPSQAGADLLAERFPDRAGADARVVVHDRSDRPIDEAALAALRSRLATVPHLSVVSPARLSPEDDTALIDVNYDVPVTELNGSEGVDALRAATIPTERAGLQVELGGQLPENLSAPNGTAELVGVLAALVILLLAFGSVVEIGREWGRPIAGGRV